MRITRKSAGANEARNEREPTVEEVLSVIFDFGEASSIWRSPAKML
jgi:hypothetical protein